jgi:hypothetical protein
VQEVEILLDQKDAELKRAVKDLEALQEINIVQQKNMMVLQNH